MSKINTGKITGKVRVRILRPWRGYAVGAVIKPPGALAQIVLQTKDQLGNPVAEQVLEPEPEARVVEVLTSPPVIEADDGEEAADPAKGPDVRPRKNRR